MMELLPIALTHLAGFLLFIWVIKKYAVGPVMGVLDERRERIASQFDQVDAAEKRVTALRDEYEKRIEGIDEEAHRRMTEEVNRGRRIAEEIAENARREAANIIQSTRSNIQIQ
ncbi:MAG TPA: ATP synthase F0 subunit B, partial [Sumerlaeia bacterium]|nr:ATP synthase F0 subunit B [Sumerlaeia bacterium]